MDRRAFLVQGTAGLAIAGAGGVGGSTLRGFQERKERDAAEADGTGHGETRIVYSVDTTTRAVALTFDDGPHPRLTPPLLDLLERRGIPATFFLVAEAAQRHPKIVARIVAAGHEVGNHSWSHPRMAALGRVEARQQVTRAASALATQVGTAPSWFRPPRGVLSGPIIHAATAVHENIAIWSASYPVHRPLDSPGALSDQLMSQLGPGGIIDLHDGTNGRDDGASREALWRRQLAQLPRFLDVAGAAGYWFVTLSALDALGDRSGASPQAPVAERVAAERVQSDAGG